MCLQKLNSAAQACVQPTRYTRSDATHGDIEIVAVLAT